MRVIVGFVLAATLLFSSAGASSADEAEPGVSTDTDTTICWAMDEETGDILYAEDGTPIACPPEDASAVIIIDPLQTGFEQLGKPYIWGSRGGRTDFSPYAAGFDCSGLVAYVEHVAFGRYLPAQTDLAYRVTDAVPRGAEVRGDLVFWNMKNRDPHMQHMALYLGDGMILQAGGRWSTVNVDNAYAIGTPEFRRMRNGVPG